MSPTARSTEMGWYVFLLVEAEVDKDGLGPTYRLVANPKQVSEPVGAWEAGDAHAAIRKAAQRRDGIYAAAPADSLVVDRWPLTMDWFAA